MVTTKLTQRARLGPTQSALDEVLGDLRDCDNLLLPLRKTSGIIFPYTPNVMFGGMANYGNFHFTHSNFPYYQYQNSQPSEISLTADFTAQTNEEARYMLAVLKFLRASTMIEYGTQAAQTGKSGTPPPVLRFNYMGGHMFNNIPVVVTSFNYILENDVDYVRVQLPGNLSSKVTVDLNAPEDEDILTFEDYHTYMPTMLTMTVMMQVQPNPRDLRDNFNLDDFKNGSLIGKGYI